METALQIYEASHEDLISALNLFDTYSSESGWFDHVNKANVEALDRQIKKEIFSTSCAAKALVGYARNIQNSLVLSNHKTKLSALLQPDQYFIFQLRNTLNHITWVDVNWQIQNSRKGRSTHYCFDKKCLLLLSGDWNLEAQKYINSSKEHIDVRSLFVSYNIRLKEFYSWFLCAIKESLPDATLDHQRCLLAIKKHQFYQSYNMFISLFLQQPSIDAYTHLSKYLDAEKLKIIDELPKHSVEQVDAIISFVDEYEVCDTSLRNKVYILFKVRKDT